MKRSTFKAWGWGFTYLRGQIILAFVLATAVTLFESTPVQAASAGYRVPEAKHSGVTSEDDCVPGLALARDSKALIRYTISCAVRERRIHITLKAGVGQELTRASRRIAAKGPGALGPARCVMARDAMTCRAQKTGPVTYEGWLMVKSGTRCRDGFTISAGGSNYFLYPLGCPEATRQRPPSVAEIKRFRREHGLDLDISEDGAAIKARAIALRQALRDGDPSALVAERTWGVPLRDVDLRELEYRLYYKIEGSAALHRWFDQNASATYAGSWIDEAAGGLIYVRFTGDQDAQLAALRSAPGILAPERIVGYGVPTLYSMAELSAFANLVRAEGLGALGLRGLMTTIGIDIKENKVAVGATDPELVASVLIDRFGPEAPIAVDYRSPPVPKPRGRRASGRERHSASRFGSGH